jgi:hypothetical protein
MKIRIGSDTHHRSTLQNGANDPNYTGENYGLFTANSIGELSDSEGTQERTCRHGRNNSSL